MSRYSRLPIEAISDQRLNYRDLKVLAALWVFANSDGRCYPKNWQIAEITGIREKDVAVFTARLAGFGWLEKSGHGGRSTSADFILKTTPDLGEVISTETTPNLGVKPPPNTGRFLEINHPQSGGKTTPDLGVKTTPDLGVGIQLPIQQPINNPITVAKRVKKSTVVTTQKSEALSVAKKASPLTPEMLAACRETWSAYATAYANRYGVDPVRNAKVSRQVVDFVKRVGMVEAPHIAAFYPTHSARWYVQIGHSVDALLKDAEKLRTEWATNRRITTASAIHADKREAAGEALSEYLSKVEARYAA